MTSDELARIIGAMTERPWAHSEPHGFIVNKQHELGTAETYQYENSDNNAAAIVALANHADAFLELVAACEAFFPRYDCGPGVGELQKLRAALAAVHAVGKEGT